MDKVGNWEAWPEGDGDTNTVVDPVTDPGEGSAELRILSINTYPPEDDQILVEVIVENAGDGDTGNGFFTDIHVDHIPVGANDFTGSVRFWVNDPIPAYSSVSLTAVLDASSAAMMGATTDSPAAAPAETSSMLYAQVDSTGVVTEANNANNITEEGTALCFAAPDASESANWPPETLVFELGQPLVLNLHTVGDEDWLAVDLEEGKEYSFTTSDLGPSADTYLYLYKEDTTTLIASNDDAQGSLASQIVWEATATGTYYLRVTHWNPTAGGCGTTYTILYDQTPQNTSDIEFVGQTGGVTRSVAAQGAYAYVGEGPRLTILNVSNPGQPAVVGRSPALPGVVFDVAVSGDLAYVADGIGGLQIVDITPASVPVKLGAFATQGEATSVVVSGDYAYLADYNAGLHIVDISNPSAPDEVGLFASALNPIDVAIAGNYIYLAEEGYGLRVIDVSDPANPIEIGQFQTLGYPQGVAVYDHYAYLSVGGDGVYVLDVADPTHPIQLSLFDGIPNPQGLTVQGNTAYVATGFGGLQLLDVSAPGAPTAIGQQDTPGYAAAVVAISDRAYVSDRWEGLRIVNVDDPEAPFEEGFYDVWGNARDVVTAGDYAYVASEHDGLRVVDISDPTSSHEIGALATPGDALSLAIAGSYVYVADYHSGLRIIDIANPANPTEAGYIDTPGTANDVAVAGTYAYVADGPNGGLRVIDVTDPAQPYEVDFYNTPGWAFGVAVANNLAYVADEEKLLVIDVSNPASPTLVSSYDIGFARGVDVVNSLVYVASASSLHILDASVPSNLTEVGEYNSVGWAADVSVEGSYAYIADTWVGLHVVRIDNPSEPTKAGEYRTPGGFSVDGVTAAADHIYVADSEGGLAILRFALLPTITSFTPLSGEAGTVVTINGTKLTGTTNVMFGNTPATNFTVVSATQITAVVPAGATTGKITITTPNGAAESVGDFTIIGELPTISGFNPTSGPVGTSVTISGAAFSEAMAVTFNGVNASSFTVNSATQITAVVPTGATTGKIAVTTPSGTTESNTSFTVIPSPTIASFSPTSGPIGTSVTITGSAFNGTTAVTFNSSNAASFTANSATQFTAVVPAGATTGKISVTTPGGTATSAIDFTVIPPPTISSFTPTSGPAGTSVTITGTAFTGTTAVTFNGVNATSFTVNSPTQITAVVPAGPTTGKIAVTTPSGTAESTTNFNVIPLPTISSFTPTSGPTGTAVTLTGTAFTGTTVVTFNGVNATSFTVNSTTQIIAVVPAGATTGKIAVTTPGGTATSTADFTVTSAPNFPDVFYISPSANVTVGSIAAQGADILRYIKSTNSWAMAFDGSNHGLTKNVSAFTFLDDGSLLFVLAANQTVAGLGTATPYDVIEFTPNTPGVFPLGAGTFSWYFQGKPKGLTTTGEKIDAIDVVGSRLLLSIAGGGSVPKQGGGVLKAADEDVFVWNMTANAFEASLLIDGSKMTGMGTEDISGLWDDPDSNDYYITIVGTFNLGGVKGNDKNIVKLSPNGGASVYTPSLVTWLAAGATLPSTFKIDGIELVR